MGLTRGKEGYIKFPNLYHLFARIHWWEDYSIEENYSIISAEMEIKAEEYDYLGTWFPGGDSASEKGQILIDGNAIASMSFFSPATHSTVVNTVNEWCKVKNIDGSNVSWSSGKIYHNSDGTASATISTNRIHAYGAKNSETHTFGTISEQTISLTTIPRKSEITSAAAVTLGKACSVKWTPLSASFQYKLKFSLLDWSHTIGDIKPNITSPYTYTGYTIPMEVANQLPNVTSGVMTVTLYTYSGSTEVGETSATFDVTVPENADTIPAVTDLVLTAVDTPFGGVFVQGNSKVQAAFDCAGRYGATIISKKMTVEGKTYTEEHISDYIGGYGDIKVTIAVTDTRGFTGTAEGTIYVCAYSKPQVKVSVCQRCNENGEADDSGTYLAIEASRSYSKVVSGEQKNHCVLRYRYAKQGATLPEWTTLLAENDQGDSVNTGALQLNLAKDAIYIVEVGVIDTVGSTSETSYTIMTETVFMHEKAGGNGIGFGMYCQGDNQMDVAWDAHFHGGVIIYPDPNNPNECKTLHEYIKAVISEG